MVILSKKTIQRLAVLHALSLWRSGAYGSLRLHKTLFFADQQSNDDQWRLFTFKKYYLGQYSDEVVETLNDLRRIGRVSMQYDGPSDRLRADLPGRTKARISTFFRKYFRNWHLSLDAAFKNLAYLTNDAILARAHDDPTYTTREHGEIIFASFDAECVDLQGMDSQLAEELADLVDVRLQTGLEKRLAEAAQRPARGEDWRKIYFAD